MRHRSGIAGPCVPILERLRRSAMSARAPATRPKSSVGAVLAVCTSATMNADGVSVAISQAAIVACMVQPSATRSNRNKTAGTRRGAAATMQANARGAPESSYASGGLRLLVTRPWPRHWRTGYFSSTIDQGFQ